MITADQARQNAEQFDLTADEILAKIEQSIDANSRAGAKSILTSFKKAAASDAEIQEVLGKLNAAGFDASLNNIQPNPDETVVRIEW